MRNAEGRVSDYERIARAISFITRHAASQPSLEEIAAHVDLSPFHFQRMFGRWAGVTPKRFLQALTVERAKQLLAESRPLLEVSDSVGLSSGSRLHDHFVQLEAATPGDFKLRGAGLTVEYGVHDTPFGKVLIAVTARGICGLEFLDGDHADAGLGRLRGKWPHAAIRENSARTAAVAGAMFSRDGMPDRPLSLYVAGTNFQINVWRALLRIPPGKAASYAEVAAAAGRPGAARAAGRAVGDNPVAFLIPCHRVIRQSGELGGYRWGEVRKHALHAWETARYGDEDGP